MKRDIILIIEEGIMLGVFGGGVVTAFEEADLYPRVFGVSASSAGSHDAAFFLSQQSRMGSSIYYDDLCGNSFINKKKIFKLIWDLVTFKHKRSEDLAKVADLDHLMTIEKEHKMLDVEKIKQSPIHFFVRVYDIENHQHKYIDAKQDTIKAIYASSSSLPFYPKLFRVNGGHYFDGSVVRTKSFLDIVKRNPDKKIVYIINHKKTFGKILITIPLELVEFVLLNFLVGPRIALKKLFSIFNYPTVKELKSSPNVYLAENKIHYHATCTDREKLIKVYKHGLAQGEEILKKL